MTPRTRRVLQAILYEVFAIAFVGPVLGLLFDKPFATTMALAVVPLAGGAWAHTQGEPLRRSDMAELARLSLVLLALQTASLVGNYY